MRRAYLAVAAISVAALFGCTPTTTPTANTTSTTTTTSTTATSSPKPADTKTVADPSTTKSTGDSSKFQEVKIDELATFKHKSGLFKIDIPKGWSPQDTSKPGETIVLWFDPSQNALIAVDIFKAPEGLTPEKRTELLETFLKTTFGSKPGFSLDKPTTQPDGSTQIVWGFDETVKGVTARIQGNSFIGQEGDKVSVVTTGAIEAQFPKLKDSFTKIVSSYKVDASVAIP